MDHEYAAFHGSALNKAYSTSERLGLALRALELYEAEVKLLKADRDSWRTLAELTRQRLERVEDVIEKARAWRDWRREWILSQVDWSDEHVRPVVRDLARAVDAQEES